MATISTITKKQFRRTLTGAQGLRGLFTGTASDATDGSVVCDSTHLVDQSSDGLLDRAYDSSRFRNAYLLLNYTTPESHRSAHYSADAGSIEVGRTFATTPVTATTEYEVHTHGLDPVGDLDAAINWVCENSRYETYAVLAGLADPDGAQDGASVDSGWTGTNATLSKVDDDADGRTRKVLRAVTSATDGYAGKTVAVGGISTGQPSYKVFGTCKAAGGTAKIVVRDLTNGADISVTWHDLATVPAATYGDWVTLYGTFSLPSGCVSLSLRLQNTANAATTDWKDVGLHRFDAEGHSLPTWVDDPENQIAGVYSRTRQGVLTPVVQPPKWRGGLLPLRPTDWPFVPVIHAGRPFGAPSAETTTLPKWAEKWLISGALAQCYKQLATVSTRDGATFERKYLLALQDWRNQGSFFDPVIRYGRPRWSLVRQ